MEPNPPNSLELQLGQLLRQRGLKLATAESCTGGLLGHLITEVAGSSEYYLGGVTAYANEAKERLLGVSHETLAAVGAVSPETALEMARGVRQALGADLGISTTGIAGPGGAMPGKPVGLVYIGLSTPDGDQVFRYVWPGSRSENKLDSAHQALRLLLNYLDKSGQSQPSQELVTVQASWTPDGPNSALTPVWFSWRAHTYLVESTGRRWNDAGGQHVLCMAAGGRVFELILATDGSWRMGFRPPETGLA